MSKRNSREAKAQRRKEREEQKSINNKEQRFSFVPHKDTAEIIHSNAQAGYPEVPRTLQPIEEMMKRPDAYRVPEEDLQLGMAAAVVWRCSNGCG